MRSAHTAQQVREAEEPLLAAGPEGALMKRASAGLATALATYLGRVYGARVLLLVGAGNNGGDALYAGASLAGRGARVDALLLVPGRVHPDGLAAFRSAGGRVVDRVARVDGRPRTAYDVAVDGIVGIGGSGPLRPEAAEVVAALDGIPFVAVDVPSGVDVDSGRVEGPHVRAALTVTFGTHKAVHLVDPGAQACGVVELVDIGLYPPVAPIEALQATDVRDLLPVPSPSAHKYTRGVVGVRAGSDRYRGAGVLSVAGAASGLAGMVRFVPAGAGGGQGPGVVDLVQAAHPEIVVGEGRVQAWVVGSGGGEDAAEQLREACRDGVPVVVDADALAEVSGPLGVPAVLTPHAGELARMLGVERQEVEADQLAHARQAAERYDAVVLLKNRHTLAAHPDGRVRVTTVGPPWLATAGAGDVLGGLVGALLAAGLSPLDAASVGSWLHGAAAAFAGRGGPLTASDVARAIPDVCARLLR
ncbi:NAD(P)H-hydrate dehydratase [Nocardioides sp. HDW12B]|uniref:NAD(P)H-hydrate dehydratase n=1 Tax=Nocardioides sp. HDW12B TaxID=2714939 RepID=UPI00140C1646|nr:NAD(P)H-hydrate dehydratase [Nocardioides sp. HDW12B]QIK65426.1 NAD(P)H-hydrate dehydratase [Nocardioides sp. HDW12B]